MSKGIGDVFSQIQRTDEFDDNVFSTQDLSKALDVSRSCAVEHIHDLHDKGQLEHAGHREETDISGRKCQIPVYRILEE